MSSEQARLTAYPAAPDPEPAPEPAPPEQPRWRPQSKQDCQGCGSHVTPQFRKSLGDDDDVAHACRNCVDKEALLNGAAADPEHEKRVQFTESVHVIGGGES